MQQRVIRFALSLLFAVVSGGVNGAEPSDVSSHDVAAMVPGPDGFLSSWLALGPLPSTEIPDSASLSALRPEAGEPFLGRHWTATHFGGHTVRIPAKQNRAALLYVRIVSPIEKRIRISTGSNGPIRVWLSGQEVLRRDLRRKHRPDTDLAALSLKAGDNDLLILLQNPKTRGLTASIRFMTTDFAPETDITAAFPGATWQLPEVLEQTGRLRISRAVSLIEHAVTVEVGVRFPGGRPISAPLPISLAFVDNDGREETPPLPPAPDNGSADLPLAAPRWTGDTAPLKAVVRMGKARFARNLGFRMKDVLRLAKAAKHLEAGVQRGPTRVDTRESLAWRIEHLTELISNGDEDYPYIERELMNTVRMTKRLSEGEDPYDNRRHDVQRRGYRSPLDGSLQPYVLYVPWGWKEAGSRTFPLTIMLHGLNSGPMKAMQAVFGIAKEEDQTKQMMERHPKAPAGSPMFVLAPYGFGNAGYRGFGEADILTVLDTVMRRYRIDPDRIYITGPSMGGIGAASLPLHYPDRFAAAAPLCGYHSAFLFRSVQGKPLLPFERFLLEARSNAFWAENGRHLPLYIVHGLRDRPAQSRVLVNAYRKHHFPVTFKTLDLGHNVWDETYSNRQIFSLFAPYRRKQHPRIVTFKTASLRYPGNRFLRIDGIEEYGRWAEISAEKTPENTLNIDTVNTSRMTVRNDDTSHSNASVTLRVDDTALHLAGNKKAWTLEKREGRWHLAISTPPTDEPIKRYGLSGPMEDAYFEPLLFVYGTENPAEARLSRRIAQALTKRRGGTIRWPIKADREVSEADILSKSIVLIGTPAGNGLLGALASSLPIRANSEGIAVGTRRYEGPDTAAAFIYPNPLNPTRYLTVYTAASLEGLFYVGHLPDTLPDYVVFDGPKMTSKYGRIFDTRPVLTAGYFDGSWRLPQKFRSADTQGSGMSSRTISDAAPEARSALITTP